ncbi:hypothetical protein AQUCO_04100086v1 [Aquilegia coerulea]|uniref:RING-type E3 ubiquitin transferase n=1 Tax=Aquilegia coerulea TaxID=218851 RepID=A0A2G5CQ44_AQUCA|nr:hypothetical protein AQUCO_04100086v1 [Aquilegia coerulea]
MSTYDRTNTVLWELGTVTSGVVTSLALAYGSVKRFIEYHSTRRSFNKVLAAKIVPITDLRSLILSSANEAESNDEKLIVVRGLVRNLSSNVLVDHASGKRGVVLQETHTCIEYKNLDDLLGWDRFNPFKLLKPWKYLRYTLLRTVPFQLEGFSPGSYSDSVVVNLSGSTHSLPLKPVFDLCRVLPKNRLTLSILYPVGLLEVKLLPLGKEITAIGFCSLQDGNLQIKACENIPYFLTELTKYHMVENLGHMGCSFFIQGVTFGSLALFVLFLTFATFVRNRPCCWQRWKDWRQRWRKSDDDNSNEKIVHG